MVENKELREENDEGNVFSGPYDVDYFATKFGIRKDEVEQAIRESGKQAPVELEEYLAEKYNLPKDNPDSKR